MQAAGARSTTCARVVVLCCAVRCGAVPRCAAACTTCAGVVDAASHLLPTTLHRCRPHVPLVPRAMSHPSLRSPSVASPPAAAVGLCAQRLCGRGQGAARVTRCTARSPGCPPCVACLRWSAGASRCTCAAASTAARVRAAAPAAQRKRRGPLVSRAATARPGPYQTCMAPLFTAQTVSKTEGYCKVPCNSSAVLGLQRLHRGTSVPSVVPAHAHAPHRHVCVAAAAELLAFAAGGCVAIQQVWRDSRRRQWAFLRLDILVRPKRRAACSPAGRRQF